MNKNRKAVIAVVAVIAVILVMLGIYKSFGPKTSEGTKAYSLEVMDDMEETRTYEGKTDAETLKELMDELAAQGDFSYEGDEGEYGLYIMTVNGVTADYAADGAYWAIYVNGEYGQYGADTQPVEDGDAFRLVYEK